MLIICTRCAAADCECVPYDTDCEKNFKPKVQTTDKEGENSDCQNS